MLPFVWKKCNYSIFVKNRKYGIFAAKIYKYNISVSKKHKIGIFLSPKYVNTMIFFMSKKYPITALFCPLRLQLWSGYIWSVEEL